MDQSAGITGLLYAISGYLLLQVALNMVLVRMLRARGSDPRLALVATFWSGVINACYLGACGYLLLGSVDRGAQETWPLYYTLPAGLATGVVLWYVAVLARKLGIELFGKGKLIAAEDAILAVPPRPAYVWYGLGNLALLQPFGRELFFRGAMLPLVAAGYGWPLAVGAVLLVELLLKLNVVWVFAVTAQSLILGGLYYATGSVAACILAAAIAGLVHGLALNRISQIKRSGQETSD